jgi:hypothetical protein
VCRPLELKSSSEYQRVSSGPPDVIFCCVTDPYLYGYFALHCTPALRSVYELVQAHMESSSSGAVDGDSRPPDSAFLEVNVIMSKSLTLP